MSRVIKIVRSMIDNAGLHFNDNRGGAILINDSSNIDVGDKFTVDGVKAMSRAGWHSDGTPKYNIYQLVITAVSKEDDIVCFFPAIRSEGAYRNVTSMLAEGMELKELNDD